MYSRMFLSRLFSKVGNVISKYMYLIKNDISTCQHLLHLYHISRIPCLDELLPIFLTVVLKNNYYISHCSQKINLALYWQAIESDVFFQWTDHNFESVTTITHPHRKVVSGVVTGRSGRSRMCCVWPIDWKQHWVERDRQLYDYRSRIIQVQQH